MSSITYAHLEAIWIKILPLGQAVLLFTLLFFLANFVLRILQNRLMKRAVTKKQISTVLVLTRVLRYIILGFLVLLAFSAASDSLQQFGFTVSILSAAIGFALQKPITGLAAWAMLVIKRPFEVGDRVTIGIIKGNVKDITLTHVYLEEVGRYGGEEISGRTVIIANSRLFEENIINYSFTNEYVLGQIIFTITFESSLDEATAIALRVSKKYTDQYAEKIGKEAHIRIYFTANGIEIHPRYYVPVNKAQEIASKITRDVFMEIKHHSDIKLAYQQHNVNIIPKKHA